MKMVYLLNLTKLTKESIITLYNQFKIKVFFYAKVKNISLQFSLGGDRYIQYCKRYRYFNQTKCIKAL